MYLLSTVYINLRYVCSRHVITVTKTFLAISSWLTNWPVLLNTHHAFKSTACKIFLSHTRFTTHTFFSNIVGEDVSWNSKWRPGRSANGTECVTNEMTEWTTVIQGRSTFVFRHLGLCINLVCMDFSLGSGSCLHRGEPDPWCWAENAWFITSFSCGRHCG